MNKIKLKSKNQEIQYQDGLSLRNILRNANVNFNDLCMGRGKCGKCKIKYISGKINPISKEEKELLSAYEIENNIRLACYVYPEEELTIDIFDTDEKYSILTSGFVPKFATNPSIMKKYIDNLETHVMYNDDVIGIEIGDTREKVYGVAVDIGTTTVALSLVDMIKNEEVATDSSINLQNQYGQDVITRISYEIEYADEGINTLKNTIVDLLNKMIINVCNKASISVDNIYEIVVAANTTMLHMLLGISAISIGVIPFKPSFTEAKSVLASSLNININQNGMLYCLPSVSSYIGADIVAGVFVSKMYEKKGNILFIDIGTNGEIVLKHDDKLYSCSCAAGPALEGMNISCGMKAGSGAIESISIDNDHVSYKVIGNCKPVGICGSGILSAISEFIKNNLITKNGLIAKQEKFSDNDFRKKIIIEDGKKRNLIIASEESPILITQKDVRQVQLAKGAILSGIICLLNETCTEIQNIDKVIIAGQFGMHLSIESLVGCGILPKVLEDKIEYIGNSSKTGAFMSLLSRKVKEDMSVLSKKINYVELSKISNYEKIFTDCLKF